MIKKICMSFAILTSNAFLTAHATPVLSFTPSAQTITLGGQASVNVTLSGLEDNNLNQILSAYDISFTYNDSVLSYGGGSLFSLGNVSFTDGSGIFTWNDFSLESDQSLQQSQGNNYLLATLLFNGNNVGSSNLSFTVHDLTGLDALALDHTVASGSINVSAVPVPGAVWLFGSGIIGLYRIKRTTAKKNSKL